MSWLARCSVLSVLISTSALVGGCFTPAEEETEGQENNLGERSTAEAVSTNDPAIALLDGYTSPFDLRHARCIDAVGDVRPPVIGQTFQTTTIKVVKTDIELATSLGVDASFAVRAPLVNAQGSASLLRNFKASSSSVNYLIQVQQSYRVVANTASVALNGDGLNLLTRPNEFLARCGDRYVSAIVYGARIDALLTFETASEDRALNLEGSISGGGTAAGTVALEGSVKAKLADASKRTDLTASIAVTAQGFEIAGDDALVGINSTIEQKLERIDVVAGNLSASLRADRERDVQDFANNRQRNAMPIMVHLTPYSYATNAGDAISTLIANQEKIYNTEKFLRAFGQLQLKMEHAYQYEIAPFQNAGPESQATFNLMPPAAPKRYSSELQPIASAWAEKFRSDDGLNVGTETQKVQEALSTCVQNAKIGNFDSCRPGTDPKTLPVYVAGARAIDDYLATGRIVKMRTFVMDTGRERGYDEAVNKCKDINGWVDRLPTADEAARIAPLVAGYGGGGKKSIWTQDTASCQRSATGQSFFSNPIAGGSPSQGCDPNPGFLNGGNTRAVICVPQSGPVGSRADL